VIFKKNIMAFKMKGPSLYSSSPLRNDDKEKKKEIKDNIDFDEQYNIFYDKDIQRSYEQQRGRFAPKRPKKNNQQDTDRLV
tara:strand:- start:275 stop:517 length:243 start_codon:yes stop_codon:yes gene_type:complete